MITFKRLLTLIVVTAGILAASPCPNNPSQDCGNGQMVQVTTWFIQFSVWIYTHGLIYAGF